MAIPLIIAAGVMAAKGIYSLSKSVKKNREAKKIRANTKRPVFNRATELDNAYGLAASDLDSTALSDLYERQANNGLSESIDAVLKSGGRADFNSIYNNYGGVLANALQIQNQTRAQRIANLNNTAYSLAKGKATEFQYNKDAPFKDQMQLAGLLNTQAEQQSAEAFSDFAGAASALGTGLSMPGRTGKSPVDDFSGDGQSPVTGDVTRQAPDFYTPDRNVAPPTESDAPLAFWDNYKNQYMNNA